MTEIEKVLYTAKTHTSGGREGGGSRSPDGRLDVKFLSPGTAGSGTNPEQLFAAGWSACFISAMKIAADKMRVALPAEVAPDAEVDVGTTRDAYSLAARLYVSLPGTRSRSAPSGSHGPVVSILQRHTRQHRCCDQPGLSKNASERLRLERASRRDLVMIDEVDTTIGVEWRPWRSQSTLSWH
jgi:osmotically inducible protein OsmC